MADSSQCPNPSSLTSVTTVVVQFVSEDCPWLTPKHFQEAADIVRKVVESGELEEVFRRHCFNNTFVTDVRVAPGSHCA